MPNVWPPKDISDRYPNIANKTLEDLLNNGTISVEGATTGNIPSERYRRQLPQRQQQRRMLQQLVEQEIYPVESVPSQRKILSKNFLDELFPPLGAGVEQVEEEISSGRQGSAVGGVFGDFKRNITASIFTINLGPWLVGTYEIDGRCYKLGDIDRAPPPETSLLVSRAMGIIAAVSGFAGFVAAIFNCGADDKTRRQRNRYIAVLYALATVSTWLMFLIHNISACHGEDRTWDKGPLAGLVLQYGRCECRAGCFLTITAGCCFIVSVICVLTYSG